MAEAIRLGSPPFHPPHARISAAMGVATLLPVFCCCCSPSSSSHPIAATLLISPSPLLRTCSKTSASFHVSRTISGPALSTLPPWNGLKQIATPVALRNFRKDKKGKFHGKVVYASLFGVGAPEALVIGVVALLVFGPKGLAEVARNLGKTLRAFQPTIRELQEVSREFKNTLEREIGIDEIVPPTNYVNKSALYADEKQEATIDPNGKPPIEPYSSEDLLKVTEAQLAASAATFQTEATPKEQTQGATSKFDESTPKEPAREPITETTAASSLKETRAVEADAQAQSSDKT